MEGERERGGEGRGGEGGREKGEAGREESSTSAAQTCQNHWICLLFRV